MTSPSNMTFDDLDDDVRWGSAQSMPPYQYRDQAEGKYQDELEWFRDYFYQAYQGASSRLEVYRYHNELFKGLHWRGYQNVNYRQGSSNTHFQPRHSVNFIYDTIDGRSSLRSKRKANLSFIPNDQNSISDMNNAKACQLLYNNFMEEAKLNDLHTKADQDIDLFGDCFIFVDWDPLAGGIRPGDERVKGYSPRRGDVRVRLVHPNKVVPQYSGDKYRLEDLDHIEFVEWESSYAVRAQYPDFEMTDSMGRVAEGAEFTQLDLVEGRNHPNEVLVHYFYHRVTPAMPQGRFVKWTETGILEEGPLPFTHGRLPVVHDGDIVVPERFWHQSFISQVEQMQRAYNHVYSSVVRDFGYNGPKWMVPKGSNVKEASLGPGHNIVEYQGMNAPIMQSFQSTHYQNFDFLKLMKDQTYEFGKVYDISRGNVPAGVTANSALRFLDEQETRRSDLLFKKKSERIVKVGNMIVSVMAQHYRPDDRRIIRSIGASNEYVIKDFKGNYPDFRKISSVKLETASGLPDTKSGRISTVIDLNTSTQHDPIFTRSEIVEILDLGLDERFRDAASVASTSAREMISLILEGGEVPAIEKGDDLLVWYSVFETFMQSMQYKRLVHPDMKEVFEDKVMAIEGFLYEKAKVNPKMMMKLGEHEYFPRFFQTDIPLSSLTATEEPPMPEVDTGKIKSLPQQTAEPEGATKK